MRHTVAMPRGVWVLVIGVVAAAVGAGSARADDPGTTTTATTTAATATPSYAPLGTSSLPAGCVGAGAAAIAEPGRPVRTLGTPASALGASAYPSSASIVAFQGSSASGSTCTSATVTLDSVSLFGGAVTATSVQATAGSGAVAGLAINGTAVSATAGQTLDVDGWGQLVLGATRGRLRAPLVLTLLDAHGSLPAGTTIVVAFAAAAEPIVRPRTKHHQQAHAQHQNATRASQAGEHSAGKHQSRTHQRRQPPGSKRHRGKRPPLDPFWSHYAFPLGGGLPVDAQNNIVVSTAMKYLGIPYVWGGARPKSGFDCSGLVKYVFAKLGVSLPHWTVAQYHSPAGVWVAPNRLQPGDLVFFTGSDGTRKAPGHVGIYLGDGDIIDAPHKGSFVRIDSFSDPWFAEQYVGAKRIVGASLAVRHLLHTTKPGSSDATHPAPFPPIAIGPALSPGVAAVGPALGASGHKSALRAWTGVGLVSVLLLLLSGAFGYRRRRAQQTTGTGTGSSN